MNSTKLCFSVYTESERDDNHEHYFSIITYCPIDYWNQHKHLPEERVDVDTSVLTNSYSWYISNKMTQMCAMKSKEEIIKELTGLGFTHNTELETFLTSCWS